jgi:hypothetical protein
MSRNIFAGTLSSEMVLDTMEPPKATFPDTVRQNPKSNISLAFHSLSGLFIRKSHLNPGAIPVVNEEHLKILKQGKQIFF